MITFLRAVCWAFIVFVSLAVVCDWLIRRDPALWLKARCDGWEPEMASWVWPAVVVAILFLWNVQP